MRWAQRSAVAVAITLSSLTARSPNAAGRADTADAMMRRCGGCHLSTGLGRPDTASLAGLPAVYIEQQLGDYRRGVRRSPAPPGRQQPRMSEIAASMTDEGVRAVSEQFAAMPYTLRIRVVETKTSTPTIIEVPDDQADSGFVAYVPAGSLERGAALVTTGGGGRTVRCALCHGEQLRGLGPVPAIAGRSPSYQVRQLSDMQKGVRHGLGSDLMRATVARLTERDMIAIAAYAASRQP